MAAQYYLSNSETQANDHNKVNYKKMQVAAKAYEQLLDALNSNVNKYDI